MQKEPSQRTYVMYLLICLILTSCSRPKTISRQELRSKLVSAVSLASEVELFISQLQEDRITPAFARGHLAYLDKEASRSANELRQAPADHAMVDALENSHAQLDFLAMLLADLKGKSTDKGRLSADRQQAAKIRLNLEHAKEGL